MRTTTRPTMTRRHFRALADGLAGVRPTETRGPAYDTWVASTRAVAAVCSASNGAFDWERFMRACDGGR